MHPRLSLALAFTLAACSGTAIAPSTSVTPTPTPAPAGSPRAWPDEGPATWAPRPTTSAITANDLRTRLYQFSDDSMKGRRVGELGNFKGTSYIASESGDSGSGQRATTAPTSRSWTTEHQHSTARLYA